ncbi:hypothetical protein [Butyrivibrio sp. AE2032]|uniref:hypothetical protein n=1 Tax=Butyrivibrio sp. AE2032 TaxID=1458463 RepID=UPI0005563605|nr:hypothetical protein [Butyrivibrio sp. AE2032]
MNDEKMYRYISFSGFLNIIIRHIELFKNPTSWEDTYEGAVYRALENKGTRRDQVRWLYRDVFGEDALSAIGGITRLIGGYTSSYAQCWSSESNGYTQWKLYSQKEETIRISSNASRITQLLRVSAK